MDPRMASIVGRSSDQLSPSYDLQLAYEESIRKAEAVIREEDSRQLRLRILILEEENNELHEQLTGADERINNLEQECTDWREQIDCSEAKSHRQETQLRMKVRELNNIKAGAHLRSGNAEIDYLQAELSSMSGVSLDSTKILTEKLSLARELATLKPELEHLRTQATCQQTILTEKLALQREVNTLEVELQTEKRSVRHGSPQNRNRENVEALESQIYELRTEVSKERREKEKLQRVAEKDTREWESRKAVLEGKVEQLRAKIRESKTRVKSLQNDLVQAQAVRRKHLEPSPRKHQPTLNSRKRTAVEMTTDKTIGTPDGFSIRGRRLTEKKSRRDQGLLAEKSMFSITPYLNRTVCVGPGSPLIVPEPKTFDEQPLSAELITPSKDQRLPAMAEDITTSESDAKTFCKQDILTDSKNTAANRKVPPRKGRGIAVLGKLTKELEENADLTGKIDSTGGTKCSLNIPASTAKENEPQKKRRKLLGTTKTLFDEEDGSANQRPSKAILGPVRSFAKGGHTGGNISLGADTQRNSAAFRAFSPLKKDKRSLQASFLA